VDWNDQIAADTARGAQMIVSRSTLRRVLPWTSALIHREPVALRPSKIVPERWT